MNSKQIIHKITEFIRFIFRISKMCKLEIKSKFTFKTMHICKVIYYILPLDKTDLQLKGHLFESSIEQTQFLEKSRFLKTHFLRNTLKLFHFNNKSSHMTRGKHTNCLIEVTAMLAKFLT